ncbi:hypothetical protein ACWTU6_14470 [Mesorhizobium sp. BHbsci]
MFSSIGYNIGLSLVSIAAVQTMWTSSVVADTLRAKDCSPILNQVVANSIEINVRCDPETELDIMHRLAQAPWGQQCHFRYPDSWNIASDKQRGIVAMFPGVDNYFSRFDFKLSFGWSSHEYDKDWKPDPTVSLMDGVVDENFIDTFGVNPLRVVDRFRLRYFQTSEFGSDLRVGNVSVVHEYPYGIYQSEITIADHSTPEEDLEDGDTIPEVFFRCEGSDEMNIDTFMTLCKIVVEKTTATSDFSFAKCGSQ